VGTLVHELELPVISEADGDFAARRDKTLALGDDRWLLRDAFGFSVWRYEDTVAILRDKRWHNAAGRLPELFGVTDQQFLERQRVSILSAEGDVHTRLRRIVGQAFSPRAADRLRPFMREVVNRLVDPVAAAGRADVAIDICEPYPIPIICELLGAPEADWQFFSRVANDILEIFSMDMASKLDLIIKAQDDLDAYTREMIAERRDKPADDLLTALIAAEEAGDKLDNDELVMMVNAVIVGGTDTTRNQLGCAVALFAEHPDQWALLAARPERAARAVEETMRYAGAVRGTGRFASEDIEYRGVLFPEGTFLGVGLAEANRDEHVFPAPTAFDITAPAPGSPQLTFGSGIHYCLGAALARAELQEALPLLAQRMPNLALDGPTAWKPEGVGIFGPASLPVRFDPGH
jgi:cytochrome P450